MTISQETCHMRINHLHSEGVADKRSIYEIE